MITELGIFDFGADGRARLTHIYPDVTVDQVRAATGFELSVAGNVQQPAPPSVAELAVVRSLDTLGVRRSEFADRELARSFGRHLDPSCAC
jgi:glutaconate CoA-transferase subunit B